MLLVACPAVLALDHGGVLPWTMWAASVGCLGLLAWMAANIVIHRWINKRHETARHSHRSMLLVLILLAAGLLGFLQTIPIPVATLRSLSPGSAQAYADWLGPLRDSVGRSSPIFAAIDDKVDLSFLSPINRVPVSDAAQLTKIAGTISVAPWLTLRTAAWCCVLAGFAAAATTVLAEREGIQILLCGFAAMAIMHAAIGLQKHTFAAAVSNSQSAVIREADDAIGPTEQPGKPFGTFVNRNNAAVILNLGVGCALGLLTWRVSVVTGNVHRSLLHTLHSIREVGGDPFALLGMLALVIGFVGLLACGSRGGALGGLLALLLSFQAFASLSRFKLAWLLGSIAAIALLIGLSLVLTPATSLTRMVEDPDFNLSDSPTIGHFFATSGRLRHLPDGLRTIGHHWFAGAGMGAYGYAYLPYQQTGPAEWFTHADNLWLEWPLETGLIGSLLFAAAAALLIVALFRLRRSAQPLDHGLCVAGWFAVISLSISQLFDFGLLLSGGSLAMVLLSVAVLARGDRQRPTGVAVARRRGAPWLRQRFDQAWRRASEGMRRVDKTLAHRQTFAVVVTVTMLVTFLAQNALKAQASGDFTVRQSSHARQQNALAMGRNRWDSLHRQLSDHCRQNATDFEAHEELANLLLHGLPLDFNDDRRAKSGSNPNSGFGRDARIEAPALIELFAQADAIKVASFRAVWHRTHQIQSDQKQARKTRTAQNAPAANQNPNPRPGPNELVRQNGSGKPERAFPLQLDSPRLKRSLQLALRHRLESLRHCPLSPETRLRIARLDFVSGDLVQTRELVLQAAYLRRESAPTLRAAARIAAQAGDWDTAAAIWRRAIRVDVGRTDETLNEAARWMDTPDCTILMADLIPPTTPAMRIGVKRELQSPSPNKTFLHRAARMLTDDLAASAAISTYGGPVDPSSRSGQSKAQTLALVGDIYRFLGDAAKASKNYKQSLVMRPRDHDVQLHWVQSMADAGKASLARLEARRLLELSPENERLQTWLETATEFQLKTD